MYGEGAPAGKDPAFFPKYHEEINHCYDVASNYPQSALDKDTFLSQHGHKMIFFKCSKQVDISMCAKSQILRYLEASTGEALDPVRYGVKDKYDAAAVVARIMSETDPGQVSQEPTIAFLSWIQSESPFV